MARRIAGALGRLNRLAVGGTTMEGNIPPSRIFRQTGGNSPASKVTPKVTGGNARPAQPAGHGAPSVTTQSPPSRQPTMRTGGNLPAYPTAGARSGVGRLQQFEHQGVKDKRSRK